MPRGAGFTVTMFLIDVSPSMGKVREVELPLPNGETQVVEMTNLEWACHYVKLKIQEMIYNGRKTEQCGVILFGTEETKNLVNARDGGYDHVYEYIAVGQPNAATLAKLSELQASTEIGDPIDALIVGIETQDQILRSKPSWRRKIVLVTDGENPIEIEDWKATVRKLQDTNTQVAIIGVDFDSEDPPFHEEGKSDVKRANEEFFRKFVDRFEGDDAVIANCQHALSDSARPEIKEVKPTLVPTELRIGDVEGHPDEALNIKVKLGKLTGFARPKSWKRFARREKEDDDVAMFNTGEERVATYAQLSMATKYVVDHSGEEGEEDEQEEKEVKEEDVVEKETLQRGYKYGSDYVPAENGFERLSTKKGIDVCGFIRMKELRRELEMGEVSYVYPYVVEKPTAKTPKDPFSEVAFDALVQAMYEKNYGAVARLVTRDGMDPKMGVLAPSFAGDAMCLLWVQMPFADDVRKYTFPSLEKLINKNGEVVTEHPYLPTPEQQDAMDDFVDAMDLMQAAKDDEGERVPWFDSRDSFNPALHRIKQAQLHAGAVTDLKRQPLPPPHEDLLKYFEPPAKLLKRARAAIDNAKAAFKVKEVPKRIARTRKDGHVHARDDDDEGLLLDAVPPRKKVKASQMPSQAEPMDVDEPETVKASQKTKSQKPADSDSETEPESDEEELLLDAKSKPSTAEPSPKDRGEDIDALPTPELSQTQDNDVEDEGVDVGMDDEGRAPGRIIGEAHPLEDIKANLKGGDLVSKVVEDIGFVVKSVVVKPFASKRTEELIECMKKFRELALDEDEIDAWNTFLQDLKILCLEEEPGNTAFWDRVTDLGRDISLISKSEAEEHSGTSKITEARANAFIRKV